ncbi:MAG: ROK family protein [Deinococcales bacterium]
MMKTLGIDLGGTKILAAVVEEGKILASQRVSTPQTGASDVLDAMAEAARVLLERYPTVKDIGVGSPGPLDLKEGRVIFAPNVANMTNVYMVRDLKTRLGNEFNIVLENDANAAGFAEHLYGAAHAWHSSVFITVSTGIGAGLYVGDKIVHGAHGSAGELGHISVMPRGPLWGDGHGGTLESMASGRAMERDARYAMNHPELTTRDVFALAAQGDSKALKIIDNAAFFMGVGMANMQKIFDPEGFVIGGGVSLQGDAYLDKVKSYYNELTENYPRAEIQLAQLGVDAGVIGAASVALYPNRGL